MDNQLKSSQASSYIGLDRDQRQWLIRHRLDDHWNSTLKPGRRARPDRWAFKKADRYEAAVMLYVEWYVRGGSREEKEDDHSQAR